MQYKQEGFLYVVSGPSGAGKGTLLGRVMEQDPKAVFSVSATTRAPREGEQDGKDYFFVSNKEFSHMIDNGEFLEYADVFGMSRYGTPKKFVQERIAEGCNVMLDIDVQGAVRVKQAMPEAVMLFVAPPSMAELEQRLRHRGTETEDAIQNRLRTAKTELEFAVFYDYVIINDNVDDAVQRMQAAMGAAQCRPACVDYE